MIISPIRFTIQTEVFSEDLRSMRKIRSLRAVFLAAALAIPASLSAGPVVLFGDIGPGFPGDTPLGHVLRAGFAAVTFMTSAGGSLSQVELGMSAQNPENLTAGLYADSAGEPGTLLESFTIPIPTKVQSTTVSSLLNPVLSASTRYWFVFAPLGGETWFADDQNVLGGI
ncbi:MAG TPA: choice-of-anchor R domain-containing protein, partial [Bryobacteraceae bacterium]|nr:choice-of-anchor R domain-containing protein [Bryobacteraceae bacterium]